MDPHRVDILDRADDDAIVGAVAHDFHLIFLPPDDALVDQHLGGRAGLQPRAHEMLIFLAVIGDPPASPAQREARPDDGGKPDVRQRACGLVPAVHNRRARTFEPDAVHRVAEFLAVLGLLDRFRISADQLHPQPVERPALVKRERRVERRLPAHRREQGIGSLGFDDLGDDLGRDRLDIGRVGQLGIGHDRRRVRIDDDDAIALGLERLDRLRPGVIKLRRLADDDRASADDENGRDVGAAGHY